MKKLVPGSSILTADIHWRNATLACARLCRFVHRNCKNVALGSIIIGLAIGCSSPACNVVINRQDSLSFQTEWPWMQRYSGVYLDDSTRTEFVFSGDPHTHQTIRVFDSTGAIITDVPLRDVLDSLGEVDSFTMTSNEFLIF
jgi:hypothetical protein